MFLEGVDALPDCEKVHVQGFNIKELVTLIRENDEIKSNRYRDALTAEEEVRTRLCNSAIKKRFHALDFQKCGKI